MTSRETILKYIQGCEHSPTIREIAAEVGLSPATVHKHVYRLTEDGLLGYHGRRIYAKDAA